MIRKWSYLVNSHTSFYSGDNACDFTSPWQKLNYKHFRSSVKLRKKKSSYTALTKFIRKRQYIRKARRRSFMLVLYIYKNWANLHLKLRQFWRFYQLNGLFAWEASIMSSNFSTWAIKKNMTKVMFNSARLINGIALNHNQQLGAFNNCKSLMWKLDSSPITDYSVVGIAFYGHNGSYVPLSSKYFSDSSNRLIYFQLLSIINSLVLINTKELYMTSTKLMLLSTNL